MTKYDKLDKQILAAIRSGASDFTRIFVRCEAECVRLAHEGEMYPYHACRLANRRLQALRRRGAIEYVGRVKGWRLRAGAL